MLEAVVHEPQFGHHSKKSTRERVMTHLCVRAPILSESTGNIYLKARRLHPSHLIFHVEYMHLDELV